MVLWIFSIAQFKNYTKKMKGTKVHIRTIAPQSVKINKAHRFFLTINICISLCPLLVLVTQENFSE